MNRPKLVLPSLMTLVLAACGAAAASRSPQTTTPPSPAASSTERASGEPTQQPSPHNDSSFEPSQEPGSPYGRHDTAPGSVATFLTYAAGGGGLCVGNPESGPPSVELDSNPIPVSLCAFNFVPGATVDMSLQGPGGWSRKSQGIADELGTVAWELNDLPSPIQGEYALRASQDQTDVRSTARVSYDDLRWAVLPYESVRIGEKAQLFVTGGPPGGAVPAYLYSPGQDGLQFAAQIGPVHLDENGEGRIPLTPQRGDQPDRYLVAVPWPEGTAVDGGQEFEVYEPQSRPDAIAFLNRGIRGDLSNCSQRKDNLPIAAIAGVECRPASGLVDSVGFYLFENQADMLKVYFARLAANGVQRDSGGCRDGHPGEIGLTANGDDRVGCFLNNKRVANIRWTLSSGPLYVGVLGNNDDIASLLNWSTSGATNTNLWSP